MVKKLPASERPKKKEIIHLFIIKQSLSPEPRDTQRELIINAIQKCRTVKEALGILIQHPRCKDYITGMADLHHCLENDYITLSTTPQEMVL